MGTPKWHARAFGLDLSADFCAAGIDHLPAPTESIERPVTLELANRAALRAEWPAEGTTTLVRQLRPAMTCFEHPLAGYLLETDSFGSCSFARDGSRLRCAPPASDPRRWQRFLTGQVLPFAAVLRGLEVFHASVVALDGAAIAVIGDSGAGKTSVAVHLMLAGGAELMADDVLVVEHVGDDGLVVHPTAGVLNLRHAEAARLGSRRDCLGTVLGEDRKGVRLRVERAPARLPLGAVYFLHRGDPVDQVLFEESPGDPRRLLASTFNFAIQTPSRLARQLDVCSRMALEVPLFRARVPGSVGAEELARRLEEHALDATAASTAALAL